MVSKILSARRLAALLFLSLSVLRTVAQDAEANATGTVGPAAETVSTGSTGAGAPLASWEATQLTEAVLTELSNSENETVAQNAHLFAFDNSSALAPAARARLLRRAPQCKTYLDESGWPSKLLWGVFDLLLGGALEPIIPLASVCYQNSQYDNYDDAKCAFVTKNWSVDKTHYSDPGSVFFPTYQGKTCLQSNEYVNKGKCTQGGYSSYSVNVSTVAQIQLAINFARSLNLRLVVKNTGHDYNGRSTGKGALSIWTHNLKDMIYLDNYQSPTYKGKAMKIGAGVQGFELYEAAEKRGLSAVAGICPSVGIAGGYSTGGGHSPLMQLFGMGADQVVALEVVTAAGQFVTATPEVNSDLYWAMLGGGGGTFGVITSAIVKLHPKVSVTTSVFNFTTSASVSNETFWEAVKTFWDEMPAYNKAKTYSYFFLATIKDGYSFGMNPFFATNKTVDEFDTLTKPFFDKLKELNIPYQKDTRHFDSFKPAYDATFGTLDYRVGAYTSIPGNRILPAANWEDATANQKTFDAVKHAVDNALRIGLYHQAPANPEKIINSVNPAFRREASMLIAINAVPATSGPSELGAGSKKLTEVILGPIVEATPLGGTYANEADIAEPNWQKAFWGDNYKRLVEIKNKWDPTDLFYVHHGVGSEGWYVEDGDRGVQTQDGKLCRV